MSFPKLLSLFQSVRIVCPEQKEDSFLTSPQPSSPLHSGCCANNRSAVLNLHPTLLELGAQGCVKAQPQSPETLTPGFGVEEEEREDLLPPQCFIVKSNYHVPFGVWHCAGMCTASITWSFWWTCVHTMLTLVYMWLKTRIYSMAEM